MKMKNALLPFLFTSSRAVLMTCRDPYCPPVVAFPCSSHALSLIDAELEKVGVCCPLRCAWHLPRL
jgi:hypothetical protein